MSPRALVPAIVVFAVGGALALWTRERTAGNAPSPAGTATAVAPAHPSPRAASPAAAGAWRAEPVRTRTVPRSEAIPAIVRCPEAVVVRCAVRAHVASIAVRPGARVAKGDVLVRLDPAAWTAERDRARAAGDARRLAAAEAALAGMDVRAPADGVVYRVHAELGLMPPIVMGEPGPFVELFDWKAVVFEGTAPAALATLLAPGASVTLRAGPEDTEGAPGAVVAATAAEDGSVVVRAGLVEPPDAALAPDAEGAILVPTGEREALVVPVTAVTIGGTRATVRVVPVEGPPVEREVTLGPRVPGGMIEVRTGLGRFESVAVPQR